MVLRHNIKALSDELVVINSPLDDINLVIHTLNDLGLKYKEILASLCTIENPIGFEKCHDLLKDYETHLTRDDATPPITSSQQHIKVNQTLLNVVIHQTYPTIPQTPTNIYNP